MNIIRRAIIAQRQLCPISLLQQNYSLSSSTTTPRTVYSITRLKTHHTQNFQNKSYRTITVTTTTTPPPQTTVLSNVGQTNSVDWARPTEIPWQEKVVNSVNLIGQVKIPVQFEASSDGNYWAGTIIAQDEPSSSTSSPPFWIPLIFEGDLAHIAVCHLKEKDYVHVAGHLSVDVPPFKLSEGQANFQVMVQSINFVDGSPQSKQRFVPCKPVQRAAKSSASVRKKEDPALSSWRDLLNNPNEWQDCIEKKRSGKVNANYPDFKHNDNGQALWLDRAPEWALRGLGGLEFYAPASKDQKDEDSWKELVEKPKQWWDNRADKLNKKSPDFKHKDTGKGLWLTDAPAWALSSLPPLKPKQPVAAKRSAWASKTA